MTQPKPSWSGYEGMVASWGYEVAEWHTIGDYQGDFLVLLRDGNRWGFLCIGYGSCTGCDALQGAEPCWCWGDDVCEHDWTPVIELSNSLREGISWHSADEFGEFIKNREHEWFYYEDESKPALKAMVDHVTAAA